jgi:hypothetical protein
MMMARNSRCEYFNARKLIMYVPTAPPQHSAMTFFDWFKRYLTLNAHVSESNTDFTAHLKNPNRGVLPRVDLST